MKVIFLGTGTSTGVPMIGCDCPVCSSSDRRNRRRRTALYVLAGGRHVVVDTPPDFREQALEFRLPRVDALLYTHSHADHVFGFDDIRRFNTIQQCVIPAYASSSTVADLKRIFNYVDVEHEPGLFRPRIEFMEIAGPFDVGDIRVVPLEVAHGSKPTLGYLFSAEGRTLGYVPDCHEMPDSVVAALRGADVMILDTLRYRPHKTHLSLEDSLAVLSRIGAKKSYLVHMCHDVDHQTLQDSLPASIWVSYDGLTLEW